MLFLPWHLYDPLSGGLNVTLPAGTVQLKGVVEESLAKILPVTVVKFVTRNWMLVLIIGFVLITVGGLSIYLLLGEREKKKRKK